MWKLRRNLLSQNFLHSRKLVESLVRSSFIGANDLVLEIGPGSGIITEQLVQQAAHVVAVEIDTYWYKYLQEKFLNVNNLTLYLGDILGFSLPKLPYKVFANIPFAIEGKVIRKLIDADNPPEDCYLVVMKELANRLAARYRENQFSLLHKPWFTFEIPYQFKRTNFAPPSTVDAVVFRFTKRQVPLLPIEEKKGYQRFISLGFGHGLPVVHNLRKHFGKINTMRILNSCGISKKTRPSELSLEQWIRIYKELI